MRVSMCAIAMHDKAQRLTYMSPTVGVRYMHSSLALVQCVHVGLLPSHLDLRGSVNMGSQSPMQTHPPA